MFLKQIPTVQLENMKFQPNQINIGIPTVQYLITNKDQHHNAPQARYLKESLAYLLTGQRK